MSGIAQRQKSQHFARNPNRKAGKLCPGKQSQHNKHPSRQPNKHLSVQTSILTSLEASQQASCMQLILGSSVGNLQLVSQGLVL